MTVTGHLTFTMGGRTESIEFSHISEVIVDYDVDHQTFDNGDSLVTSTGHFHVRLNGCRAKQKMTEQDWETVQQIIDAAIPETVAVSCH